MRELLDPMFDSVGTVTLNVLKALNYVAKGRVNTNQLVEQMAVVGADSMPLVLMVSMISGSVLALHASEKFAMTGANEYVGALVALSMVREMGPIMAALAIGARVGTAFSAELANMAITNQIDAMKMMHVSPIRYLFMPRLLATLLVMPMLTILSEFTGVVGGMVVSWWTVKIHPHLYLSSVWHFVKWYDIQSSLLKSLVFAVLVSAIALTIGLQTRGGSRQVGLATTYATVWAAITVLVSDFFLTWMLFGTRFEVY
ncbi:MAG: ABC transporter permease [Vampirovibrionales bacterium]